MSKLRIVQDLKYPGVIAEIENAMRKALPNKVGKLERHEDEHPDGGWVEIYAHSKHWTCLFPQHGRGRKHERAIKLVPWQLELIRSDPRPLLRGLIHSDGCRVLNRVAERRYVYPRYFFTNKSEDILQIFADALDLLGIHRTRSRINHISVARRADVAALDSFIGPKS